ncbi:hypothetical protein [Cellulomonas citrea]|uniref:hypothetical protein n=1 Tax=Cellulomonas citrea TaxID=1909423 RepID=UPI001357E623|nr:hypothetical protein [Cellulomonas citrea]
MVVIKLSYDKIRCGRCGDPERIYGLPCVTCGAPAGPSEVNQQVQRRKRLGAKLRSALTADSQVVPEPEPLYALVSTFRQRIGDEFDQFLNGLAQASSMAEPFSDESVLVPAVRRIAETRAKLRSIDGRRPLLVQLEILRRLNHQTEGICKSYLAALEASSPIEAQRHAEKAQSEIDQLTDGLAVFNRTRSAADALEGEGDLGGTLERLFEALRELYPGLKMTELDTLGRARFSEITGVEAVLGTGTATLGAELAAAVHLDPKRFRRVLGLVAGLMHDNQEAFAAVVSDEHVRRDVRGATTLALEAYAQLALLIPSAPTEEAAFRQIIKLYKNLFEDVMAPLVAVMLLTTGTATKPYGKLISEDAADIARRALAADRLKYTLAGVQPGYRNAESHGGNSYHLEGGEAVFELRAFGTRVAIDVVVDDCFALVESLLALQVAINNEISLLGYDDHQPDDLGYFQPSKQQLVEFLLRDQHIVADGVDLSLEVWTLRLREQPAPLLAIAGGLDGQAPDAVRRFVVENVVSGLRQVLEIDRAALQEMLSIDEGERAWRSIVALAGCQLDGRPLLDGGTLRCAVAAVGIEALIGNRLDRIPRLRRVRELAARSGDGEAAGLLVAAIRGLRDDRALEVARRPEWQAWLKRDGLTLP